MNLKLSSSSWTLRQESKLMFQNTILEDFCKTYVYQIQVAKLDKFYGIYLILNQANESEITFVAEVTKINFKNFKTYLWLDDSIWETIWRHQCYRDGRFEPSVNSGRSLTWAYKLKALKSSLRAITYYAIKEGL